MKKYILFLIFLPIFTIAELNTQAIQPIIGNWKVMKFLPAAETGASYQFLQQYVGQVLKISSKGIAFDSLGESDCAFQNSSVIRTNKEIYFQKEQQAYAKFIPLSVPFTVVETDCNQIFYDKSINKYIIFNWNGDFFEAQKL